MSNHKITDGPSLGSSGVVSGSYRPGYRLGILIEPGDRVQVRIPRGLQVDAGSWGTVEKLSGFGTCLVRMDGDGRVLKLNRYQLQFAKSRRPVIS